MLNTKPVVEPKAPFVAKTSEKITHREIKNFLCETGDKYFVSSPYAINKTQMNYQRYKMNCETLSYKTSETSSNVIIHNYFYAKDN